MKHRCVTPTRPMKCPACDKCWGFDNGRCIYGGPFHVYYIWEDGKFKGPFKIEEKSYELRNHNP